MTDITAPVVFPAEIVSAIENKCATPNFSHQNWSDDDLEIVRSFIRAHYRQNQNGFCAYCKNVVSLTAADNCHVEHIAPKSRYQSFMFEPKNLCVICADCNRIKRNQETLNEVPDTVVNGVRRVRYPRVSSSFKIVHPHFDNYGEHIRIFNRHYYADLTDKGHFTIGACRLNRRLREFGWESEFDDGEATSLMADYMNSTDPVVRLRALSMLKHLLILL